MLGLMLLMLSLSACVGEPPQPECVLTGWVSGPNLVHGEYQRKACGVNPPFFCCDELCNDEHCTATPLPEDPYTALIAGDPGCHVVNIRSSTGGGHFFVEICLPSPNE